MPRTLTIVSALIALAALAAPTAGLAAKTKTVKVEDDFFSPTSVKVKKDAKVKFKWGDDVLHTHNVTLQKGPKGVKRSKPCTSGKITECNTSGSGTVDIKFVPKFTKTGTYKFICTIHPTAMQTTVKVTK